MKPTEEQKKRFRAKYHKELQMLQEAFPADRAAQDQEDHDSMVEATIDRQILAEMNDEKS